MKNRLIFYLITLVIALLSAFLTLLLTQVVALSASIPIVISVLALIFSILSSFKDELFPFNLSIYLGRFLLVGGESISSKGDISINVLLPITFFNRGYCEGVIQDLFLCVREEKETTEYKFLPSFEIDMMAFIQQMKGLNASNTLGIFEGFLIQAKKTIKKNIVFSPEITLDKTPFVWKPGTYNFELFIMTFGEKQPKNMHQ